MNAAFAFRKIIRSGNIALAKKLLNCFDFE